MKLKFEQLNVLVTCQNGQVGKKVNVEPRICTFERDLVRLTWFVVSEQFFTDTTLDTLP